MKQVMGFRLEEAVSYGIQFRHFAAAGQAGRLSGLGWCYNAVHSEQLPQLENGLRSCGMGSLGLPWLQKNGETAYLPERTIASLLASGMVYRVKDAPLFSRPIFGTYASDSLNPELLEHALNILSELAI